MLYYREWLYETVRAHNWVKVEYDLEAVKDNLNNLEDKIGELKKDEIRPLIVKNEYIKLVLEKFVEIAELIRLGKLPSLEKLKDEHHQQKEWGGAATISTETGGDNNRRRRKSRL